MTRTSKRWWTYARALALPLLLWGLVVASLWGPVRDWLGGGQTYDEAILREWLEESRGSLPAIAEEYVRLCDEYDRLSKQGASGVELFKLSTRIASQRGMIGAQLDAMGSPTKKYASQLPLFPVVYRIEVSFADDDKLPIAWKSDLPIDASQCSELTHQLAPRVTARLLYQLHAYDKRQREEAVRTERGRQLSLLALLATAMGVSWVAYSQRRERRREAKEELARKQIDQAERLLLQEELKRQEAERRREEAERTLLRERLAAQEYEQKMLELKSQLYASIGIMAGSYAHNIKNLLVRPNDLLRRCLEDPGTSSEQGQMLNEVKETLGTVTERLQQILRTVRRDPNRSELAPLDLTALLRGVEATWKDLAWERWKMRLVVDLPDEPLWVEGDASHLQQTVENLLFNARDATFEMRNQLREDAHRGDAARRREAILSAAAWKGQVSVRAVKEGDEIVLEVRDNGIGMTEEVRRRCTETHFTTKRDNANYEGHSTGMGLGLSFVQVVLDNHRARMEIESEPQRGATFRVRFPAASQSDLTPPAPLPEAGRGEHITTPPLRFGEGVGGRGGE